jgi:hypothetical protein
MAREEMTACPGFLAETLAGGDLDGRGPSPRVTSCAHLAARRVGQGRFVPSCHHPEAMWIVQTVATARRDSALRAEAAASRASRPGPPDIMERALRAQLRAAGLCGTSRALLLLSASRRRAA